MAEGLSDSVKRSRGISRRFDDLYKRVEEAGDSPIVAEVTEPYVYGSLRPEVKRLSLPVGETVFSLTNVQSVWGADN